MKKKQQFAMNLKYCNILKLKKKKINAIIFDLFIDVIFKQVEFEILNNI